MPTPKLPQYTPPTIPRRVTTTSESPRKGSFFQTLLLAFIILWTLQLLFKKPQVQEDFQDAQTEVIEEPKLLSSEESSQISEQLSDEIKAASQSQKTISPEFVTLGSLNPSSPYKMLVTLSNRGASLLRVEMNEKKFHDCADRSGYIGQIVADETLAASEISEGYPGVGIQAVGAGTPAEKAGLTVGDRILSIDLSETSASEEGLIQTDSFEALRTALLKTKPGETAALSVLRKENLSAENRLDTAETISVTLAAAPLQIVRPMGTIANYDDCTNMVGLQGVSSNLDNDMADTQETNAIRRRPNTDPASFLLTLASYDDAEKLEWPTYHPSNGKISVGHNYVLDKELPFYEYTENSLTQTESGLRNGNWEYVASDSNETTAVFRKFLPARRIEIRKTYQISYSHKEDGEKASKEETYHLNLTVTTRNLDTEKSHKLSYFLDGPTSLTVEGIWYSLGRKTGPGWGSYGLRDLVLKLDGNDFHVLRCADIAREKKEDSRPSDPVKIDYLGVDSQYFQVTLIPKSDGNVNALHEYLPIRVGSRIAGQETFTNVSYRLKSSQISLAPAGQKGDEVSENYTIFVGPKLQSTLNSYGLGQSLVYGWFWFIAKPMVIILDFLHNYIVFNYGLAIIILTIMVRLILLPISLKQVESTTKMQELQPEINQIKELYKDDAQAQMNAQRALWKKHGVNPLGGCLPVFLQIPVFCALYKILSLDVNLYGAPLLSKSIRWCSNMAAPDFLYNWSAFWKMIGWPSFNLGLGMFSLGPYLNILPLVTVALFLIQQKYMMPPPTGTAEQQAQQKMMQRMMSFMMIFMALMFFKVPCGLCIYFIVSSLWGLVERKIIAKKRLALSSETGTVALDLPQSSIAANSSFSKSNSVQTQESFKEKMARRNKRQVRKEDAPPEKLTFREKLNQLVEKAKEQQKLAKAEVEKRKKAASKANTLRAVPQNSKGKKRR